MKTFFKRIFVSLLAILTVFSVSPVSAIDDPGCDHKLTTVKYSDDGTQKMVVCMDCGETLNSETVETVICHHDNVSEVTVVNATCKSNGIVNIVCDNCGKIIEQKVVPATNEHNFVMDASVDPTCTETGLEHYTCSVCGTTKTKETDPIGHSLKKISETIGSETLYFEICEHEGCTYKVKALPDHEHTFTSEVTVKPTCITAGERTYTCSDCNESYTEVVPALGHNYVWETETEATCEETGKSVLKCTNCGDIKEEKEIPALGHDINENGLWKLRIVPTCSETGLKYQICKRCGAEITKEINAFGHNFVTLTYKKAPTCTEDGYELYTCSRCKSETETVVLPKSDEYHKFVEFNIPATCEEAGKSGLKCETCGLEKDVTEIPKNGHTLSDWTVTTEPTCTNTGLKVKTCSTEGCNYKETEVIPATGHKFGSWTVSTPATCETEGTEIRVCENCGSKETRKIAKKDHDFEWVTTVEATIFKSGKKVHKCVNCGLVDEEQTIPKINHTHDFENDTVVKAPTCREEGVGKHTCKICGEEETYTIEKVGHKYGEATVDINPTCTTFGQKSKKCVWCGLKDGSSVEKIAKSEHNYNTDYTVDKEPTCTENGLKSKHCTNPDCDAKTAEEIIPMTEHVYKEVNRIAPKCEQVGKIIYQCDCGKTKETEIPALTHEYEDNVVAPTCTDAGYTLHTCKLCGNNYTDDEVPATGHEFGEWQIFKAPTCTEEGIEIRTCVHDNCLETEERTVEKVEHAGTTYVTENVKESTCTENGSHDEVLYCDTCGEELERKTVEDETLGHNYTETVVAPTCEHVGCTVYHCDRCGDEYTDNETPLAEHELLDWEITEKPTCCKEGTKVRKCAVCGQVVETETIEKDLSAHDFKTIVEEYTVKPTCVETGRKVEKCECGEIKETILEALGHNYKQSVTKEPTVDEEGVLTFTCERCKDTYTKPIPKVEKKETPAPAPVEEKTSSDTKEQPVVENIPETTPVVAETPVTQPTEEKKTEEVVEETNKQTEDRPFVPVISTKVEPKEKDNAKTDSLLIAKVEEPGIVTPIMMNRKLLLIVCGSLGLIILLGVATIIIKKKR